MTNERENEPGKRRAREEENVYKHKVRLRGGE